MKKLFAALLLAGVALSAQAVVIQCDPAATGSAAYPNVACSASGALVTSGSAGGQSVALTDGSGTVTTGGTSQQIFAANATRQYLLVQNLSTGNLYINFGVAAVQTQPSILLLPNSSFVMEDLSVTNQTVNIIGATTGQAFTAKQK